jgi:prevent-host-death family protein
MAATREHKGHRLVPVQAQRVQHPYWVPEAYVTLSFADVTRRLFEEGWSASEISKVTGIRYQTVRNTLVEDQRRRAAVAERNDERTLRGVEQDDVGSTVPFSALVQRVERGGEVTITRDGKPVAQLISHDAAQRMAAVREAMAGMDEIRKRTSLGGLRIKDLINEGRR